MAKKNKNRNRNQNRNTNRNVNQQIQNKSKKLQHQAQSRNRMKSLVLGLGIVAVAVVIIVVVVLQTQNAGSDKPDLAEAQQALAETQAPAGSSNGEIYVQGGDSKTENPEVPTVLMFLDPICPGCGSEVRSTWPFLKPLVEEGKINLKIAPVAIQDKASGALYAQDQYSTRAAASIAYVANNAPDKLFAYVESLFTTANQPPENGYELQPDSKFVELAKSVGIDESIANGIMVDRVNEFSAWTTAATNVFWADSSRWGTDGKITTPQSWINGVRIQNLNNFEEEVTAAIG